MTNYMRSSEANTVSNKINRHVNKLKIRRKWKEKHSIAHNHLLIKTHTKKKKKKRESPESQLLYWPKTIVVKYWPKTIVVI